MKDSQGRYWCVPCGEADQKKRAMASPSATCAGCHQQFSKGKLDRQGDRFYCKTCLKKRSRVGAQASPAAAAVAASTNAGPALRSGGGGGAVAVHHGSSADNRRAAMMVALLVALVLFALLYHFVILAD